MRMTKEIATGKISQIFAENKLPDDIRDFILSTLDQLCPRWIPVSERLPEAAGSFLCAIAHKYPDREPDYRGIDILEFEVAGYKRFDLPSEFYYDGPFSDGHYFVTHWMDLPAEPKKGE